MLSILLALLGGSGLAGHRLHSFAGTAYSAVRIEAGGHCGLVQQAEFADENTVVTAGEDKTVRIWGLSTQKRSVIRYACGPGTVGKPASMACSRNGLVAVGLQADRSTSDADLILIDTKSARILTRKPIHKGSVTAISFSPDGTELITGGQDGAIRVLSSADLSDKTSAFKTRQDVGGNVLMPISIKFSLNGHNIAVAYADGPLAFGEVYVVDKSGKDIAHLLDNVENYSAISWTSTGKLLYSRAHQKGSGLFVWNAMDGSSPVPVSEFSGIARSIAFQPGSSKGTAVDLVTGVPADLVEEKSSIRASKEPETAGYVQLVAFSPRGSKVLRVIANGEVVVSSVDSGATATLKGTGSPIHSLTWCNSRSGLSWSNEIGKAPSRGFDLERLVAVAADTLKPDISPNSGPSVEKIDDGDVSIDGKSWPAILPGYHIRATCSFAGLAYVATELGIYPVKVDSGQAKRGKLLIGPESYVQSMAVSPDGNFLAAGSLDGTIRIWSKAELSTGKAMLTLFMGDDGQWVLWNDETCYYACSSKGDDFIGVQTNQGIAEPASFKPAYDCRAQYNREDVIKDAIKKASFGSALTDANLSSVPITQAVGTTTEILGLTVSNATDEGGDTWVTSTDRVSIKCKISNPDGQQKLIIRVGRGLPTKDLVGDIPSGKPDEIVRALPPLHKGKNVFELDPVNGTRIHGQKRQLVVMYGTNKAPEGAGTFHIVCVGAAAYTDTRIQKLSGSENDANDVASFYEKQAQAGLGKVVVHRFVGPDATKEKVEAEFTRLCQKDVVQENDTVIVYMSGHGFSKSDDKGAHCYFAPIGANLDDLAGTCLDWQQIIHRFDDVSPNAKIVLFVDQCHAGAINMSEEAKNVQGQLRSLHEPPVAVFASCSSKQLSLDTDRNGVFTQSLLEALNDNSLVVPNTKMISLLNIGPKVVNGVRARTTNLGWLQSPRLYSSDLLDPASVQVACSKG